MGPEWLEVYHLFTFLIAGSYSYPESRERGLYCMSQAGKRSKLKIRSVVSTECELCVEVKGESVSGSVVSNCDPMDCNPPGSSVHGILQATVLEWVAIYFSRGSSQPRAWTQVCIAGGLFTTWTSELLLHYCEVKKVLS